MPRPIRTDVMPRPRPTSAAGPSADVRARLEGDNVVTRSEAQDLAALWGARTVTRAEADAIRAAVAANLDRFEPAAKSTIREFTDRRLPHLTIENPPVTPAAGVPANAAKLSWTPPTLNSDGTPLTDLAGYKILYGTAPGNLTNVIDVSDPSATSFTVGNLAPGTWYFAMKAVDASGNESVSTPEVFKTIR